MSFAHMEASLLRKDHSDYRRLLRKPLSSSFASTLTTAQPLGKHDFNLDDVFLRHFTLTRKRFCLWAKNTPTIAVYFVNRCRPRSRGQVLDRLVPVSFTRCRASTSGLSTWSSSRSLTLSWRWEISSWGGLHA